MASSSSHRVPASSSSSAIPRAADNAIFVVGSVAGPHFIPPNSTQTPDTYTIINCVPGQIRFNKPTVGSSDTKTAPVKSDVQEGNNKNVNSSPNRLTCSECGKTYASDVDLSKHLSSQHRNVIKTFNCLYCSKTFFSQSSVISHLKSVLLSKNPSPNHKAGMISRVKHTCPVCNKDHVSALALRTHLVKTPCGQPSGEGDKRDKIECMRAVLKSYRPRVIRKEGEIRSRITLPSETYPSTETQLNQPTLASDVQKSDVQLSSQTFTAQLQSAHHNYTSNQPSDLPSNHQSYTTQTSSLQSAHPSPRTISDLPGQQNVAVSYSSTNHPRPHFPTQNILTLGPCNGPPQMGPCKPAYYPAATFVRAPLLSVTTTQYYNLDYYQNQPQYLRPPQPSTTPFCCGGCGAKFCQFEQLTAHVASCTCTGAAQRFVYCSPGNQF